MDCPVGAVGKHLAGIVGQGIGASLAVFSVGGRHRDLLDQGRISVSTDMGFESMNRWSALMLDRTALIVVYTGRGDDHRIDQDEDGVCIVDDVTGYLDEVLVMASAYHGMTRAAALPYLEQIAPKI